MKKQSFRRLHKAKNDTSMAQAQISESTIKKGSFRRFHKAKEATQPWHELNFQNSIITWRMITLLAEV